MASSRGASGAPVLICGGAGYIGSHVVRGLLDSGRPVVIADDLSTGHRESVPDGVELIVASIGSRPSLDELFARYDFEAVIHLCASAYVGESVTNPRKYYRNNIANGLLLLEAMLDHEVKQIVFSSSCTVYGCPGQIPIQEQCRIAPISPYGHTKAMFERILSDYDRAHGLRWVALRYFNAAGAIAGAEIGEDHTPEPHLIPLVLRQALHTTHPGILEDAPQTLQVFGDDYNTPDGTCRRDYIHVMDLASGHCLALDYLAAGRESIALNLSSGTAFSVLEIVSACEEITGQKIHYEIGPRRQGDPDELVGNATNARPVLGWQAEHSSIQNIVETAWQWHKSHPRGYASQCGSSSA